MTAMLMDAVSVATPAVRVRPRRARRVRAGGDPRATRVGVVRPTSVTATRACRVSRPRPRVTITEAAVAPAAAWQLTERGWAVVVLAVSLAFGSAVALMIWQFLAVTAGLQVDITERMLAAG